MFIVCRRNSKETDLKSEFQVYFTERKVDYMKTFYIRFINHDINKTGLYWCKTTSKRKAINMFKREKNGYCEILEVTECQ